MKRNFCFILLIFGIIASVCSEPVLPGDTWKKQSPEELGLSKQHLDRIAEYLGGRGFISRDGYQVFTWGDYRKRGDVASAAKPFYSFFVFKALEEDKIPGLDQPVAKWEPRLKKLNPDLEYKDKNITWRHLANQTSCYGVKDKPGKAFDYNDWQMALFWDLLFLKVYETSYKKVDESVFHPKLTDIIGCEDNPTMLAFGVKDRAGRVAISPRDFARFGLLFMHQGQWDGKKILKKEHATKAVNSPLPADLPRAGFEAAEMLEGQRSIGSRNIPDNQCDHEGCYSWLWWINGVDKDGNRRWPDAPDNVFSALGHKNGKRGMAVLPTQKIVISWNDTKLDRMPGDPHPLNEVFRLLMKAQSK